MASSPSSSSEPDVMEQVITELFAKSLYIILESRFPEDNAGPFISSYSSPTSSKSPTRDKWFNSTLKDCPTSLDNFDIWRHSNLELLVVDVILNRNKEVQCASCTSPAGIFVRNLSSGLDEFGSPSRNEKIVERWSMQYESQSISQPRSDSSSQGSREGRRGAFKSSEFHFMCSKVYRRITVLLRSMYSAARLLPAYKLFKVLSASGNIGHFSLSHRISSFAEPFSREEDAKMSQFDFGPFDIFSRKFSLSVAYLKTIEDVNSEPSTPLSAEYITDYVGSPLADPLKRFPSLSIARSTPSYAATFRHQCSWCRDHGETPLPCSTPSHTYSDSQALYHNLNPLTCALSAAHTKKIDEHWPLPQFSSSSSSLATATHLHKSLSLSESVSISIPLFRHKELDGTQNQNLSSASCSNSKRCSSHVETLGNQGNKLSAPQTISPENKQQFKRDKLRLMEFQTYMMLSKTCAGKNSIEHMEGLKTPLCTPHLQSKSSSKLSFMDEFDDSDFICHFAEDDVAKNLSRVKFDDGKDDSSENLLPGELMAIRRSPDAAVGSLVKMLRNAPPLRLDKSNTFRSMQPFKDKGSSQKTQLVETASNNEVHLVNAYSTCLNITTPELCKPRTVADAFKELLAYKGFRELILKQSGSGCSMSSILQNQIPESLQR